MLFSAMSKYTEYTEVVTMYTIPYYRRNILSIFENINILENQIMLVDL